MGNWHISIEGVGQHHNSQDNERDAEKMSKHFVKRLKEAGHHISKATFTHGAKEELTEESK